MTKKITIAGLSRVYSNIPGQTFDPVEAWLAFLESELTFPINKAQIEEHNKEILGFDVILKGFNPPLTSSTSILIKGSDVQITVYLNDYMLILDVILQALQNTDNILKDDCRKILTPILTSQKTSTSDPEVAALLNDLLQATNKLSDSLAHKTTATTIVFDKLKQSTHKLLNTTHFSDPQSPLVQTIKALNPLRVMHYNRLYKLSKEDVSKLRTIVEELRELQALHKMQMQELVKNLMATYYMTNDKETRAYIIEKINNTLISEGISTVKLQQGGGGQFSAWNNLKKQLETQTTTTNSSLHPLLNEIHAYSVATGTALNQMLYQFESYRNRLDFYMEVLPHTLHANILLWMAILHKDDEKMDQLLNDPKLVEIATKLKGPENVAANVDAVDILMAYLIKNITGKEEIDLKGDKATALKNLLESITSEKVQNLLDAVNNPADDPEINKRFTELSAKLEEFTKNLDSQVETKLSKLNLDDKAKSVDMTDMNTRLDALINVLKDEQKGGGNIYRSRRMIGAGPANIPIVDQLKKANETKPSPDARAATNNKIEASAHQQEDMEEARKSVRKAIDIIEVSNDRFAKFTVMIHELHEDPKASSNKDTAAEMKTILQKKVAGIAKYLEDEGKQYVTNEQKNIEEALKLLENARASISRILASDRSSSTYKTIEQLIKFIFEGTDDLERLNSDEFKKVKEAILPMYAEKNELLADKYYKGFVDHLKVVKTKIQDHYAQAAGTMKQLDVSIKNANINRKNEFLNFQKPGNRPNQIAITTKPDNEDIQFKPIKAPEIDKDIKYVTDLLNIFYNQLKEVQEVVQRTGSVSYLSTMAGEPSMFLRLLNNYNDNKAKMKSSFIATDTLVNQMRAHDLIPREVLGLTTSDRMIFFFIILFLRLFVLSICSFMIERGWLNQLSWALFTFLIIYSALFVGFVYLINSDAYRLRIMFNYVNLHANSRYVYSHAASLWMFSLLIFFIMWNINFPIQGIKTVAISEEEKVELIYRMEVITMIIWIFLSITAVMT